MAPWIRPFFLLVVADAMEYHPPRYQIVDAKVRGTVWVENNKWCQQFFMCQTVLNTFQQSVWASSAFLSFCMLWQCWRECRLLLFLVLLICHWHVYQHLFSSSYPSCRKEMQHQRGFGRFKFIKNWEIHKNPAVVHKCSLTWVRIG